MKISQNITHYPSLERCKELTDNNFPETELSVNSIPGMMFNTNSITKGLGMSYCPSAMELLDKIKLNEKYTIDIDKNGDTYSVMIFANKIDELTSKCPIFSGTLPDALADMWLWLKKNNYLDK